MKHLHRIISFALTVAMLICVFNLGVFAETSAASAYIVSETGMKGDIINVDVWFSSDAVGSVTVNLDYNPNELEPVSSYTFIGGMKFKYNTTNIVSGKSEIRFTGSIDETSNISVSGIIMRVEFKILKTSGTSSLALSSVAYKADYTKLTVSDSSANVNIIQPFTSLEFSADTKVGDVYSKYKNISNTVVLQNKNGVVLNNVSTVRTGDTISINNGNKAQIIVPGT